MNALHGYPPPVSLTRGAADLIASRIGGRPDLGKISVAVTVLSQVDSMGSESLRMISNRSHGGHLPRRLVYNAIPAFLSRIPIPALQSSPTIITPP